MSEDYSYEKKKSPNLTGRIPGSGKWKEQEKDYTQRGRRHTWHVTGLTNEIEKLIIYGNPIYRLN